MMEVIITLMGSSGVVEGKVKHSSIAEIYADKNPFILVTQRTTGEEAIGKIAIVSIKAKR